MTDIRNIFARDPRITVIRVYEDGFVPNSYRWPAPGTAREYRRLLDGSTDYAEQVITYDRKRAHGIGPRWVAFSERGGRLASA